MIVVSQPAAQGSEEYNPYLPASRQAMPGPKRPTDPAKPAPPRTAEQIEADLAAARERLAATVDELKQRLTPSSIARRSVANVRERLTTSSGSPRPEVIAAAAVLVVGVALVAWRRQRR